MEGLLKDMGSFIDDELKIFAATDREKDFDTLRIVLEADDDNILHENKRTTLHI